MKNIKYLIVGIAVLIISGTVFGGMAKKGPLLAFPKGPMSGKITIWWEQEDSETGSVLYRPTGSSQWTTVSDSKSSRRHEIEITGLSAGTYEYEIQSSSVSDGGTFKIPSPNLRNFKVVNVGDPRAYDASSAQLLVHVKADKPDFLISVGDFVQKGAGEYENWQQFFDFFKDIFRTTPFFPSVGDHENDEDQDLENYLDYFVLPNNGTDETWYSYDWGACHFVSLYIAWYQDNAKQKPWLLNDVKDIASDRSFVISYFHVPPYSVGAKDWAAGEDTRDYYLPTLKTYADLIVAGHDHNYQYWELDGGLRYVLSGGFTSEILYDIDDDKLDDQKFIDLGIKFAKEIPHYLLIDIKDSVAVVQAKGVTGNVIHEFTIQGRSIPTDGGDTASFTCLDTVTLEASGTKIYNITYSNSSCSVAVLQKPSWVRVQGDSLGIRAPSVACVDSVKLQLLNSLGTPVDTLVLKITVIGGAVNINNANATGKDFDLHIKKSLDKNGFNITLAHAGKFSLNIFDISGKKIWSYKSVSYKSGNLYIPWRNINSKGGLYFAVLKQNNKKVAVKLKF